MTAAGKNLRTLAQTMTEFAFALRYDSIPGGGQDCGAAHLVDTLACALGARETATLLALQKHAILQGGRADATIVELNDGRIKAIVVRQPRRPRSGRGACSNLCNRPSTVDDIVELVESCRGEQT